MLPKDERDEGNCDNQQIQQVETRSAKSSFVKYEAIGDHLQHHLNSEDGCEKVIKVVQNLKAERGMDVIIMDLTKAFDGVGFSSNPSTHIQSDQGRLPMISAGHYLVNSIICFHFVQTWFRLELELRGSSAANIAEETIMQTSTMLPK